ncbi:hypothetical protein MMC22_009556 [Lobaria immixta]|nr:hypothetical protein [Lobaria immixta]
MISTIARAALLSAFLAPLTVHARRGDKVVTITNADHNVIVTSTAPPVYVTITRSAGTNDETTLVVPSPSTTPVSSSTPVASSTLVASSTRVPSSTTTPAPGQKASSTPASVASAKSSSSVATELNHSWSSGQGPLATTAPSPTKSANVSSVGPGRFTIAITNSYGSPLSLAFGSNIPGPPQDGDTTPTVLGQASSTSYTYPTSWAGRIGVGKTVNNFNSLIEASFPGEEWNSVDVSYVDGYSVPITCSTTGEAITGCNIELFDHGTCQHPVDNGAACDNDAPDAGPAEDFFTPCGGAAYTYPFDDVATWGSIQGKEVSCCIGTSCPAPYRQKAISKRNAVSLQRHSHQHHARHQDHRRSVRSPVHRLVQEAKLRK